MLRRLICLSLAAAGFLPAAAACTGSNPDEPVTRAEVATMLAEHAAALRAGQRSAFLAGVGTGPDAASFRGEQATEFANLSRLPVAHWSYTVASRAQDAAAQQAARRRFGPDAAVYRLAVSVALTGVDERPDTHDLWWTFTRQDGHVVAVSDTALARVGGVSWTGPWDVARLAVVHARDGIVLGSPGSTALLRQVASAVDAAVPEVESVWGRDWSRKVLVLVPSGRAQLRADLGDTGAGTAADDSARIAAIARTDGTDPVTGDVLDPRLVVAAGEFGRLSAVGREIVVRHEVTHLATASATTDATPTWLAEGFAEYVANLRTGQPVGVAAAELAHSVRAGRVPRQLPSAAQFASRSGAARAYEGAWLACRLVAQRIGRDGLVRFYRAVGASPDLPGAAVAHALAHLLHETPARFTDRWRGYLRRELGSRGGR